MAHSEKIPPNNPLTCTVHLHRTGWSLMRMGMGGIPLQKLSFSESDHLLESAVDYGIQFFDTARGYTDSEIKIGRILSRHREKMIIASKSFARDGETIRRDLDTSLKNLKTDCIDLYQLHNLASPDDLQKVFAPGGAFSALEKAQAEGKIRFIGISGHKPSMVLQALKTYPFPLIQIPFNYMETAALDELIPRAKNEQIGIIAMKPLGGGNIQAVGANFRFIYSRGIDIAIPGIESMKQLKQNFSHLQSLDFPSQEDIDLLEKEKQRLGEEYCRRCEYCLPCPNGLPISFLHVLKNYYFLYDLKEWVRERLSQLSKSYPDCLRCGQCTQKCPYHLDSPAIFQRVWKKMKEEKPSNIPS